MTRRKISILGATGSVGSSTLDLVERHPDRFEVVALTAARNVDALADVAVRTNAKLAVIDEQSLLPQLESRLRGSDCRAASGRDALVEAAAGQAEWVMAAIVGCAGLEPVMAAIEAGRTVALANKESLVVAGELMIGAARHSGATILPVDSEHNAIFQCLAGNRSVDVSRLILTASGGPFRSWTPAQMAVVTPEQAVAHPNWSMGAKISVDSATMMNKGLEVVEARWLFGLPPSHTEVVIHPQSIVHSMVRYRDGSIIAQLGIPDMRIPIAYALSCPQRLEVNLRPLDLARNRELTFMRVEEKRYPALNLAYRALEAGGVMPAVLNAANEVAVAAFLQKRIGFRDIHEVIKRTMAQYPGVSTNGLPGILRTDRWARQKAAEFISHKRS
jgi:1-deoxy-D-xylulose-5-phosphate reductoisomerase